MTSGQRTSERKPENYQLFHFRLNWAVLVAGMAAPVLLGAFSTASALLLNPAGRRKLLAAGAPWLRAFMPMIVLVLWRTPADATVWISLLVVAVGLTLLDWRRLRAVDVLVVLFLLLAGLFLERTVHSRTFALLETETGHVSRISGMLSGIQTITGGQVSPQLWLRRWRTHADYSNDVPGLSMTLRSSADPKRVTWYGHRVQFLETDPLTTVEFLSAEGRIWRTYTSDAPLAGRTFRLSGTLVGPEGADTGSCAAVVLRVDAEPWVNSCKVNFLLQEEEFQFEWTVPDNVEENRLRVEVNPGEAAGLLITVGDVLLEELLEGFPQALVGVVPADVSIKVGLFAESGEVTTTRFTGIEAVQDWTTIRFESTSQRLSNSQETAIEVSIRVPAGVSVDVRDVEWLPPAGIVPSSMPARQAAWFGHPNVLGAALPLLSLLLLVTRGRFVVKCAGLAVLYLIAFFADSRTGTALLILTSALYTPLLLRRAANWFPRQSVFARWLTVVLVLGGFAAVIIAMILMSSRLTDLSDGNSTTRLEIWKAALHAVAASPVTGWGKDALLQLNGSLPAGGQVSHAHNWLLEIAVRYGALGIGTAGWLLFKVTALAFRQSTRAIGFGWLLLLAANMVDNSLMAPVIWGCMVILLQAGRESSADSAGRPGTEP